MSISGVKRILLGSETYSGAAGAAGALTSATLWLSGGAAGAYAASYDADGRLTNAQYTVTPSGGSASTLYQVQPTYDALGNVIETVTTLPQGVDTQVFCYDDLSRLVWAGSSGTPTCANAPTPSDTGSLSGTGAQYSASYAYDAMNRLNSSPLGSYTYGDVAHADAATAIGSTWSASYDAAGDMTCRAATSATTCSGTQTGAQLAYDNQGQLASWQNTPSSPTSTESFLYDGEGNRVEQVATSSGTTTSTTSVGGLEEIVSTGSTVITTAYYGPALSVNGTLSYLLTDRLGSASASVSSGGSVVAIQLYGPYGTVRYSSGTLPGSYSFTMQQTDVAIGLNYDRARYYDSVAGQFTSADTTLAGGLNRYGYVDGNPETWWDPTGHLPQGALDCLKGGLAATVLCIFLVVSNFAGWGVDAMANWPNWFRTPNEITVTQENPTITNAEPVFENPFMQWIAKFSSPTSPPTIDGTDPGPGINGGGGDDSETNYTQDNNMNRFENEIETNQRNAENGDNNSPDNPDGPGEPNPGTDTNTSDAPTSTSGTRSGINLRPPRGMTEANPPSTDEGTSPSDTSTGNWWDSVTNWWNNLWNAPSDTGPCACGDPYEPGSNDGTDPAEDTPDIPFDLGGYYTHPPKQWYA